MLRVLAVIVWIAITVYAIADWVRTPEEDLPARMPKAMWLVLIIITIPSFSLGAIAWIIVRAVTRAEAGERPLPPITVPKPTRTQSAPPRPLGPDDDPEFLFRIERDIQRGKRARAQEHRESPARPEGAAAESEAPYPARPGSASAPGAADPGAREDSGDERADEDGAAGPSLG